ncbi:MAG: hypothetical protein VX278_12625 [Myxococcota bacterium]|nr:hypothetical protein [Myxococcota bacterium]
MKRVHLFEIHEQWWCPSFIRDGVRDGLFTAWKILFWKNTLPHLRDLLRRSKKPTLIDLCSGAGGPVPLVIDDLKEEYPGLQVSLTDYFPCRAWENPLGKNDSVTYMSERVDAKSVPAELQGCRTLFEAFHHFKPDDAVEILSDAVRSKQPIAVFEFQRSRLIDALSLPILAVVPIASFLHFWHTPFSFSKLLFTIIPVIPFILAFDGIISILRTYSTEELVALAHRAGSEHFRWDIRQSKEKGWGQMTCLIGWPAKEGGVHVVHYDSPTSKASYERQKIQART